MVRWLLSPVYTGHRDAPTSQGAAWAGGRSYGLFHKSLRHQFPSETDLVPLREDDFRKRITQRGGPASSSGPILEGSGVDLPSTATPKSIRAKNFEWHDGQKPWGRPKSEPYGESAIFSSNQNGRLKREPPKL